MRSVLITGGTGSFGRSFASRCLAEGVERVCIFSRGEHAQATMREAFGDHARLRWFIGDVRDRDRLLRAMDGCDVVIHAAALKRIEVGHYNPIEMVRTNVGGAVNVIEAAMQDKVHRVVALSTDKAFQPVSPYGSSKALAEALFLSANNMRRETDTLFLVTRYGNVAGSAGSVIPRWQSMIAAGVPQVPVTDPECTRFYMRMDEAIDMVWEAATAQNVVLDRPLIPTLPAYRLGDLAEAMGVSMDVRGLPDWEKRHESMGPGNSSEHARRMTVEELQVELGRVAYG